MNPAIAQLKTASQIAGWVNADAQKKLELRADVERYTSSTDTKITGTRLRRAGKGRKGSRIRFWTTRRIETTPFALPTPLFDHVNSETYRTLEEVREWLDAWAAAPTAKRRKLARRGGYVWRSDL